MNVNEIQYGGSTGAEYKFDADGKIGMRMGPMLAIGIGILGNMADASLGMWAGVGAKGELRALSLTNSTTDPSKHMCSSCMNGEAFVFCNLTFKIDTAIPFVEIEFTDLLPLQQLQTPGFLWCARHGQQLGGKRQLRTWQ